MVLSKLVNGLITGYAAVNVKKMGAASRKNSHNKIMAHKPVKKDWGKTK